LAAVAAISQHILPICNDSQRHLRPHRWPT